MTSKQFFTLVTNLKYKYFLSLFFGCRVNAAESNLISQILIDNGLEPITESDDNVPSLIVVNTCSITQKGENESLRKIKSLSKIYPKAIIVITGCASIKALAKNKNFYFLNNIAKKNLLSQNTLTYTPKIKDRLSQYHRYLLNIQTGCNQFCSYCIVPYKRQQLWSLPIKDAITQTQKAIDLGFTEVIITGVNLEKYSPGLAKLTASLLQKTSVPLISFGSVPLNCIDDNFLDLIKNYKLRIKNFLHIPIQSGSDKILKLMNRPYTTRKITRTIENCKLKIKNLKLGTDIIVGFPGETEADFQQTYDLCQSIGFSKIHTFRYSPRPGTASSKLPQTVDKKTKKYRSQLIRNLTFQTTPPFHQTQDN